MYELFTDGGSRGNPGPAGIGAVLYENKEEIATVSKFIGEATNNQAEYQALRAGLKKAKKSGISELRCFLDSELIVKQMTGIYRVKNPNIKPIYQECNDLANQFNSITFKHVRREKNKRADELVNKALDKELKK